MTMTTTANRTPSSPRPGPPGPARPAAAPRPTNVVTVDPIRVVRQHIWLLVLSLVGGVVLGGIAHVVWTMTYPIQRAATTWQINLPKENTGSLTNASNINGEQTDRIIQTVATMILQPSILSPAINSPEIRSTGWIKKFTDSSGNVQLDDALEDLTSRLRSSQLQDSLLMQLSVTGPNKDDLVAILTAINKEYQRWLNSDLERRRLDVIDPYTTQRNAVQASIQALQREIDLRIEQNKINPDVQNSDQALELNLIRQQMAEQTAQLSLINSIISASEQRLADPSLVYSDVERATARQDANVAQLESNVVQMRTALRAARQSFGSNHPQVKRLQTQLESAQSEFDTELQKVLERNFLAQLDGFRNQARSYQQALADLEQQRQTAEARLNDLIKDVEWVNGKRGEVLALQARADDLDAKITQALVDAGMNQTQSATLSGPPLADSTPLMPKLVIMLPLGVIVTVGLTTGVIFLREFTDRRIKGPGDVAMLPRGEVLGVVPHLEEDPTGPKKIELIEENKPSSVIAESIRQVHVPLSRKIDQESVRTVLFVPGQPGAGCSALTSNLALIFARAGRKVLVIDADLRRPRMAEIFDLHEERGLGDILMGETTLDQAVKETKEANLSLLTAGAERSRQTSRLHTPLLASIMAEAQARFDLVLVDSPAAVAASDWESLANVVDANVLVVRALQEERGLASRLIAKMHESKSIHLGVIVNGLRSSAGGYLKRNLQHMGQYHKSA